MSRHMLLGVAIALVGLLVLAPTARAQVDPSDILNVVSSGNGSETRDLLDIPPGSTFVLTDFEWYGRFEAGDNQEIVLTLISGNGSHRWKALVEFNLPPGTAYQTVPIGGHWTTGLVFETTVILNVVFPITGRHWDVSLSGYLVTGAPGALGEQSAPAAPLRLSQNTPNPFNPTTEIKYTLALPGEATLRFFDSQGRLVRTLVEGRKEAGEFAVIWDGRNDVGESLASGVYYYQLGTGVTTETRKAVLLK